jgi:hypothetical protein
MEYTLYILQFMQDPFHSQNNWQFCKDIGREPHKFTLSANCNENGLLQRWNRYSINKSVNKPHCKGMGERMFELKILCITGTADIWFQTWSRSYNKSKQKTATVTV